MAYFRFDIDIIGFFYLVGSPKVGGAGDGKHTKKYGHPKHDKHVTQSILVALIPNLYHGCISSSKMDDLDLSFFVRKCMLMTSPHSARRWIA